ncbi:hypothetical protein EX895_004396 [Sporisorium graminicola]|uniref:AAA+ ATPase domain-containing protein n=1 Tax=Sporisorium graminicola TaxID=280036 RepID=A0A4U7KRU9_9BASI|nr:hypothetical protein EX895_004396 [Sporisorium graminicola]TKY86756.1 hypothetical protein EX895_004396 [Sporisorium graminicola]
MPPKSTRSFQRTLSNSSNASSSSTSNKTTKLKQNKLDFSFHSTSSSSSAARPFASRPLSSTPSFGLPLAASSTSLPPPSTHTSAAHKGKQRQHNSIGDRNEDPANSSGATDYDADSLWSERLAPHTGDELAVHPKKVAQVRTWIQEAFSSKALVSRYHKVLALTGPAGAGKSATIRALASHQDLDFDILEWHHDQPSFDPDNPGASFIERFADFLSKAARFPTLELHASDDDASSSSLTLDSAPRANRRRVILLEELPNLHHLPTKQLFQASIEQHMQQSIQLTAHGFPNVPIVLVVTESTPREDQDRWSGDSSSGNTWRDRIASIMDTRSALGETIRKHPAYTEIRFNPVAPTIVLKGLKRAIDRATSTTSKTASKIWLQLLQMIAEDSNGDLRAAVNCLQFVGAGSKHFEMIVKERGAKKTQDISRAMRKMMPLVSGRESSLALFHALGRVLYNKREGDPGNEGSTARAAANSDLDSDQDIDGDGRDDSNQLKERLKRAMQAIVQSPSEQDSFCQLPEYMSHLDRRPSRVEPDQLWADLPVDSSVFQLYLHQNFPQFCTEVEQCEAILEFFSTADVLTPLHEQYRHSSLSAYYAFLLSTRGTLLRLPSPVPRSGQKLGKATWWDVQKNFRVMLQDMEDVKASLTRSAGGAGRIDREDAAGGRLKRTKFTHPAFVSAGSDDAIEKTDAGLGDEARHTTLFRSDPVTLVTEILPLLAKIRPSEFDDKINELARMRFEHAGVADMASRFLDEHETGVAGEDDDEVQSDRKRKQVKDTSKQEEEREEKLFLSDDDIGDF